jgi:hypothetical protein
MTSFWNNRWPLERVLFALAGTVTLTSALLAATISPWFLLLTAFVGVNQWLYVTVAACPASLVLQRLFGITTCRLAAAQAVTSGPTESVVSQHTIQS